MERFIWTFDGDKFLDAEPIRLTLAERVRIILVNDSMMEHPIHLRGLWSELENGQGEYRFCRKAGSNRLLSTLYCSIFYYVFQCVVWFENFATYMDRPSFAR
jgi:FtsP/CotA-like multicopper oxidase with cupredoxin domain